MMGPHYRAHAVRTKKGKPKKPKDKELAVEAVMVTPVELRWYQKARNTVTGAIRFIGEAAVGVPKLMYSDAMDTVNKVVNRLK